MTGSKKVWRFAVGDRVRLVPRTSLWGQYLHLRDRVGVVTDLVDDGTSLTRVTVEFENEAPLPGVDEGQFKPAEG